MTNDDSLFACRLRVLASAQGLGSVAAAGRLHGIHRSTFGWKAQVERFGLETLRPRGRRRPQHDSLDLDDRRAEALSLGAVLAVTAHVATFQTP